MGRGFLFILVVFLFGILLIISNNNLAMYKPDNVQKFFQLCSSWTNMIYHNLLTITGQVVKLNWTPAQ
jgi:uncharacterized membrane protein